MLGIPWVGDVSNEEDLLKLEIKKTIRKRNELKFLTYIKKGLGDFFTPIVHSEDKMDRGKLRATKLDMLVQMEDSSLNGSNRKNTNICKSGKGEKTWRSMTGNILK